MVHGDVRRACRALQRLGIRKKLAFGGHVSPETNGLEIGAVSSFHRALCCSKPTGIEVVQRWLTIGVQGAPTKTAGFYIGRFRLVSYVLTNFKAPEGPE